MSNEVQITINYEFWQNRASVMEKENTKQVYHKLRRMKILPRSVTFENFVVSFESKRLGFLLMNIAVEDAIDLLKKSKALIKDDIGEFTINLNSIYLNLVDNVINQLIDLNNYIWKNSGLYIEPLSDD